MNIHVCKCREACNSMDVVVLCPSIQQPASVVVSTQDFQTGNWSSTPQLGEIFLILDFFQHQTLVD